MFQYNLLKICHLYCIINSKQKKGGAFMELIIEGKEYDEVELCGCDDCGAVGGQCAFCDYTCYSD